MNKWTDTDHVTEYLSRADRIPHRKEGEQVLMEHLPDTVSRVLDIGTGDGRLLSMILACRSNAEGVGLDFSPAMLEQARSQFADNKNVQIVEAIGFEDVDCYWKWLELALIIGYRPQ